jgi:tagaturonate epimerase
VAREIIRLAESGGDGLALTKEVYSEAFAYKDELCAPYTTVIDIDSFRLPAPSAIQSWTSEEFAAALRHVPGRPEYNKSLRQLLHVAFKVAAKAGVRYLSLLEANENVISRNVTENLYKRHIVPVFFGGDAPSKPNGVVPEMEKHG